MDFLAQKIIIPKHIDYLVIDQELRIVGHSPGVVQFVETPESLSAGTDIRETFPELFGCEEMLISVFLGEQEEFDLRAINRCLEPSEIIYIDLYCRQYKVSEQEANYLIIFVENITKTMSLEQTLVQSNNESALLMSALESAKKYTQNIIESMADILIVTNLEGEIIQVNKVAQELLEYTAEELLGQKFHNLLFLQNHSMINEVNNYLLNNKVSLKDIDVLCRTKTGEKIAVAFSCSVVKTELQEYQQFIYIGRDITLRQRIQQRLAAQYALANILSESNSLEEATPEILQAICISLGWDVGELWVDRESYHINNEINSATLQLKRIEIWSRPSAKVGEFIEITSRVFLAPGMGLAGRVWQKRTSQWITNLAEDEDFGQESFAVKVGLKSAFAFPISANVEVLGVMTFFCHEQQHPDQELLQMMAATGRQLGQYIKRKQAEEALRQQQEKTEELLLNILPQIIAERLRNQPSTIADSFDSVTVLFADIVGFTELSAQLSPIEVVEILNVIFSEFDQLTEKHQLEKIKTIGDAYMVVGGLPNFRLDHAEAIAEMALDMQKIITQFNTETNQSFSIRIGINTGSVVAGVIGTKKFIYDLWGDAVNTASRMESQGIAGTIQVTDLTYNLLKDKYIFESRGLINIKGKGQMNTYLLKGRKL